MAAKEEEEEAQADADISLRVWKKYFSAGGNTCRFIGLIFVLILSQVLTSGSDYFVNIWARQEDLRQQNKPYTLTTNQCLYINAILIKLCLSLC